MTIRLESLQNLNTDQQLKSIVALFSKKKLLTEAKDELKKKSRTRNQ